jgi:hypothetical protein
MDKTLRAVLIGIGVLVALFLAWKTIAYTTCMSHCSQNCHSTGVFGELSNSLCQLQVKSCKDDCRFF